MPTDIITPENVSIELLKEALEAAYIDVSVDSDGDLVAREDSKVFITLNKKKDTIQLLSVFAVMPEATHPQRLALANRINDSFVIVKAIARTTDILRFEYDICLAGGITMKNFVLTLKRFATLPRLAIADSDTESIVK